MSDNTRTFTVEGNDFILDGKPIQLISGGIHYFRIHPDLWEDRLLKMKACGLNAIETYLPWNMHEPTPGTFNFEGFYDVEKFIRLAGELDFLVLVRPGPFICAEFEGGGLPWWLNTIPNMVLRCANKAFMERCEIYLDEVIKRLKPLMLDNSGAIAAMQIENEYGSYGNDKTYLNALKAMYEERGVNTLYFTSDGPDSWRLSCGTLPDVLKTVNFGSQPQQKMDVLRQHQPEGPLMCMEYWNGWFDHWSGKHLEQQRTIQEYADDLDWILSNGGSINIYMFHGGTNFGFTSGANFVDGKIRPTTTSYDYGAPLSEAGDMTEKYYAFKNVIAKYTGHDSEIAVRNSNKKAYGEVSVSSKQALFDCINECRWIEAATPLSMEQLGQASGFTLYRTTIEAYEIPLPELFIDGLHDRAYVYVDGQLIGILEGDAAAVNGLELNVTGKQVQLDILVENLGRVNFGKEALDCKGILDGVRLGAQYHFGWKMLPISLDDLSDFNCQPDSDIPKDQPGFYSGTFSIDETADTFLDMSGWTKGVVFINGFNLGRYWEIGPQQTLYIPAPLLKAGDNELIIFELSATTTNNVKFIDYPKLGE